MVEQCGELRYTDPLDKLRGTQDYRHGPSPRERMAEQRRLETPMPSLDQIDERIQAFLANERQRYEQLVEAKCEEVGEFWREVCARARIETRNQDGQRVIRLRCRLRAGADWHYNGSNFNPTTKVVARARVSQDPWAQYAIGEGRTHWDNLHQTMAFRDLIPSKKAS